MYGTAEISQVLLNCTCARFVRPARLAEDAHQLFALCKASGINHLIYSGFAINWCLLMSPGGMVDMSRHGVMCSAIRQAVTAVENKQTARTELNKELALMSAAISEGRLPSPQPLTSPPSRRARRRHPSHGGR